MRAGNIVINYLHYAASEPRKSVGRLTENHNSRVLQDALLHAIKEEYVEAVEILLEWEEKIHKPGQPYVSSIVDFAAAVHVPRSISKRVICVATVMFLR